MTIKNSTIRKLVELAHTAPSADNSQPWNLSWDGVSLSIGYDFDRVADKTFPADSPATLLSIGAVVEIVMMVADDWKLQPVLELETSLPCPSTGIYARIQFRGDDQNLPESSDRLVTQRHTNRLGYLKQSIPEKLSQDIALLHEKEARVSVFTEPATVREIASIAKAAAEVRFQTQEVHEWLGKSLRFSSKSAASGEGLDVATLGLPPGGKLFLRLISKWNRMRLLNRIGIYKILANIDTTPVRMSPGLIAVIAPSTAMGALDAGRLLCRIWIHANSRGLSVHPYYVIADQLARLRDEKIPEKLRAHTLAIKRNTEQVLELSGEETLHMLFRFGYTKKNPQLSRRLPLQTVYTEKGHP